jgi:hypothetical protein
MTQQIEGCRAWRGGAQQPAQRRPQPLPPPDPATRAMKTKSRWRKKKPTTSREELAHHSRLVDNPAMTKRVVTSEAAAPASRRPSGECVGAAPPSEPLEPR